jgi:type I restriction enzyme S subunit
MDALISQTEKLIEKKKAIKQGAMQELLKPKEGWVTKKFTDVVNYIHGKAHEQFIVENGKYEVVNSKFISTEGTVKKYADVSFLTAKKGDVLTVLSDLPNGKALAKCFHVEEDNKYAVNQRICIWRSTSVYPKFLFYFLNRHKYFMALNDGVSQTHILNGHIEKFYIEIPENYSEQQSIAETLWDMDKELQLIETKLNKLKQQKQGMMQALLTGKIRLVS